MPPKAKEVVGDKKGEEWTWFEEGTCLIGTSPGAKVSESIASFDMDDTIITRKSGAKFPKDAYDWLLLNDKVKPKIKELFNSGHKIVIFTNQAGIQKGHTKAEDIRIKVKDIAKELGV